MPKKKLEIKKRHNSAFFKYSNQAVFEKREKEFIQNKQGKNNIKYLFTYSSKNRYRNIKQNFFKEKNIIEYLKTLQSIDSNIKRNNNYFQTISYLDETNNKSYRIKSIKKTINKKKNNYNIFNLTETNNIQQRKKLYNNNSATYYYTISNDKKYEVNKETKENHKKTKGYKFKGINELLLIQNNKIMNELKRNESEAKAERIKDLKIAKFYHVKEGVRDHIEKIRKYHYTHYSTKVKKERAIRLEEIYNNKIEFYKDAYNSLYKFKYLFDSKFLIKISEYLRFLSLKIEKEKFKNSELINKIRNYKYEIESINTKMKRIEYEKSNILKWLYLQIQLKEKKLILPDHYKAIFEINIFNRNKTQTLSPIKQSIIRKEKYSKKTLHQLNINYSKKFNDNEVDNENNYENNDENNHIIDLNGIKMYVEEYERLKNYKNELIYKTPEQFNEALLNLENNNLKLINYLDHLRSQLFIFKKKLNYETEEKNNLDNYFNGKIKHNKNELNSIKSIINMNSKYDNFLEEKEKNKKYIIYRKVLKIYNNFKTNKNSDKEANIKNTKITFEEEIIIMLKFIEIKTNELINKINSEITDKSDGKIPVKDVLMKIKFEIERQHKNEKTLRQKLEEREKYRKLYKTIEARNNKIYFLPKKKLDISKIKSKHTKEMIIKIGKKENINLEGFLYD